ncbi:MAG: hypothetical protein JO133_03330 [Burkholderiaceae bacterium]|nr:hypothetical protein [Burkholderiaceae bacterium]
MVRTEPIERKLGAARTGSAAAAVFAAVLMWLTPTRAVEVIEPRAFGYTVGDALQRQVIVDRNRDGALDPASLPKPGRYGRWFQLREVVALPDGVRLAYQIINTPMHLEAENLPSLDVHVIDPGGRSRDADIGPFTIMVGPVSSIGPNETIDADKVRPDLNPKPIDTSGLRRRILGYALMLVVLAAVQLAPILTRRLGWRRAGPFARALRALRQRALRASDPATRSAALLRLHAAFDEVAGRTLALDNVQDLFASHPWLAPARASVETLLAESRASFFDQAPPPARERLLSVALQLATLERNR